MFLLIHVFERFGPHLKPSLYVVSLETFTFVDIPIIDVNCSPSSIQLGKKSHLNFSAAICGLNLKLKVNRLHIVVE